MTTEQDPFARVYDAEDDNFADDFADEDLFGRDEFGYEGFGCCIPDRCWMPGPHFPSECVSAEMMEELFAEAELDPEDPGPAGPPTPNQEEGPFWYPCSSSCPSPRRPCWASRRCAVASRPPSYGGSPR